MDSLYGGHAGLSLIYKDSFESVEAAIAACKRGPDYDRCWYGELILITTPNLNDEDNGIIFQRGLDYTNDMGGLVRIGQIVGPSGGTPLFALSTIEEAKRISTMPIDENDYRKYPISYDTDDSGHVIGYNFNTDANEPIATFPFSVPHDMSLVPGKDDDGTFNDEILWTWVNIRKPNQSSDSIFYAGFEIPYLVNEYRSHLESPYDEYGNIKEDPTTITRIDDKTHPFYAYWDMGLPKGIKGDTLRNLRVMTPTAGDTIYAASAITVDPQSGEVSVGTPGYTGQQDDINSQRQIIVYDLYYYDKKLNPDPITIYLGDFNNIEDIDLADDGTLTISYTHNSNTVFSRKIKWIDEVTLLPDSGVFTVTYNNGDPAFTTTLDWIKGIKLDDDGTLHFYHTKDNVDESYANRIKWVTNVDLNTSNGTFTMNFNFGDPIVRILDYVDDLSINETTGDITIHKVNSGNELLDAKLKMIVSATASTNGIVTFTTNTGETFNIKKTENAEQDFQIKNLENIRLNTALADDKHIQVKYNTSNNYSNIGDPINYIQDMVVRESDFHLLVLYNDPEHRSNGVGLDSSGIDAEGNKWVNNVTGSNGVNTGATIYWRDYGTIKDQSGVLIGMNLTSADTGGQEILNYLNTTYPNGLTEGALRQKIVTYSATGGEGKEFYAFDYNKYEWFYLGAISDSGMKDAILVTQGSFSNQDLIDVNPNGLVFKIINTSGLKTSAMPEYWSASYNSWV